MKFIGVVNLFAVMGFFNLFGMGGGLMCIGLGDMKHSSALGALFDAFTFIGVFLLVSAVIYALILIIVSLTENGTGFLDFLEDLTMLIPTFDFSKKKPKKPVKPKKHHHHHAPEEEVEWELGGGEGDADLNARMEKMYEAAGRDQEEND